MAALDRMVAREVAAWTAVVVAGALGLAWVTGAVERLRAGSHAPLLAALRAPEAVVLLTPLLAALGAALAAARLEARGERTALEGAGYPPWRSGLAAAGVGLGLGLLQWGVADHLLYRAGALSEALEGRAAEGWVWLGGAAVRLPDGLRVEAHDGVLGRIDQLPPADLAAPELDLARMRQRPRMASGEALSGAGTAPAVAERAGRRARVLAAMVLALLGWLPWSRLPARQVGAVLVLGLSWQLVDLLVGAMVAQGLLPALARWLTAGALVLGLIRQFLPAGAASSLGAGARGPGAG